MNNQNYFDASECSIIEAKQFLMNVGEETKYEEELYRIMLRSYDCTMLQKRIGSSKSLMFFVFRMLKKKIEETQSYDEMERYFVLINNLLPKHNKLVYDYKYQLFKELVNKTHFSIDTYQLLRHLIQFKKSILPEFLTYLQKEQGGEDCIETIVKIYCLEDCHKYAYSLLESIDLTKMPNIENQLMANHPISYLKYKLFTHQKMRGYRYE